MVGLKYAAVAGLLGVAAAFESNYGRIEMILKNCNTLVLVSFESNYGRIEMGIRRRGCRPGAVFESNYGRIEIAMDLVA